MTAPRGLILILGLILAALAVYWLLDRDSPTPDPTPSAPVPAPEAEALDRPATDPGAPLPSPAPPPWAKAVTPPPADATERQAQEARRAAYQEVREDLAKLTANGRQPSLAEVDALLARIAQIEGSTKVAGVDLAAVRRHMAIAAEMQTLATELQSLQAPGARPDPARVQELLQRLEALRGQLVASQPAVVTPQP